MIYTLEINEKPVGKGRPRLNRKTGSIYTPEKTRDFEELIKYKFLERNKKYLEVSEKPIKMTMCFYFEPPKSAGKFKKMKMIGKPYMKKPDLDNIEKAICDALNEIAYKDDCQVCEKYTKKIYGETNRIEIVLQEIEE